MEYRRRSLLIASVVFLTVLVLALLSPLLSPYGAFTGLDGMPALIDGGWQGHGIWSAVYALGDLFCHQEEARSFIINGSQMPICMRDTGILVGLVIGFALCTILASILSSPVCPVIGATLILLMVAEWLYETGGADLPLLRTASGISAGLGASVFLGWMLYREHG